MRDEPRKLERITRLAEETLRQLEASQGEDHPLTISARKELADIYRTGGNMDDAIHFADKNFKIALKKLGEGSVTTRSQLLNYALFLGEAGRRKEALPHLERASKLMDKHDGPGHPRAIIARYNLASGYLNTGRVHEAIPLLENTFQLVTALDFEMQISPVDLLAQLVHAHEKLGNDPEALKQAERWLALEKKRDPPDIDDLYSALHRVARVCEQLGGYFNQMRSAEIHEEMLELQLKSSDDPKDMKILACRDCLARLYGHTKQWDRQIEQIEALLEAWRPRLRDDSPRILRMLDALAHALDRAGRQEEALELRWKQLERGAGKSGDGHPPPHAILVQICRLQLELGKWQEAEKSGRRCLSLREESMPDHWLAFNARSMLGEALLGQEKFDEAEPLLLAGFEGMWNQRGAMPEQARIRVREALERLIRFHEERDAGEDATKVRHFRDLADQFRAETEARKVDTSG